MKGLHRIVTVAVSVVYLFLTGCTVIGPGSVTRDRFDYTAAISESWKVQMLLNIVKLRYGDVPTLLGVASVISQYALQAQANVGASWQSPLSNGSNANTLSLGTSGIFTDRPTITYSPVTGDKFARSLMVPIPPTAILNLIQAGYPVHLILRLTVQSVNGIRNSYGGQATSQAGDPEFYMLIEYLRKIQTASAVGLRVEKKGEKEGTVMVFRGRTEKGVEEDQRAVRKMLGLDPAASEFKVVYGAVAADDKEIAILSRSILQIMVDLASSIEVPPRDVAEKRVNPTPAVTAPDSPSAAPLVHIHCSAEKPPDAFVSAPYRGGWFWIDDRDILSKTIFSFFMFIFTLTEPESKEGAPIVSLPIG